MLFSVHHFFKQSVVTMPLGVCMVYMMPWPLSVFANDMAFLVSSLAFLPLLASPILFATMKKAEAICDSGLIDLNEPFLKCSLAVDDVDAGAWVSKFSCCELEFLGYCYRCVW